MRTRESGLWLLRVFASVPLLVLVGPDRSGAAAQDDLLKSLVEQNEAAWRKIQSLTSIQYTVRRQWLDRRSQRPFQGVAQVKKKGDCLWCMQRSEAYTGPLLVVREKEMKLEDRTAKMQLLAPDTSAGQTAMAAQRLVVNDRYVAAWPGSGDPLAYQWDHNSVDTMSPMAANAIKRHLPPDFLDGCFGEDRERFVDAVRMTSGRTRYEAVERAGADGSRLYEIRRFYPPDAPNPDVVWVIDSQRGFLATQYAFNAMGEMPVSHQKMRVEQISRDVWYPVGFEETRYAEPNQPGDTPRVESWSTIVLTDVRVNEAIPDGQFEIEALGLPKDKPDITVLRTAIDGRTSPYVYRGGKLVPRN